MKGYYGCRKKKDSLWEEYKKVLREPVIFVVPDKDYDKIARGEYNAITMPVKKGRIEATEMLIMQARLHNRCCIIGTSEDDCTVFDISEYILITNTRAATPIKKKATQIEWYTKKAFITFE